MVTHPIDSLFALIESRKDGDAQKSYTAQLLAKGPARVAKKFGEESVEAVLAAASGDNKALAQESADVLYHLLVLWAAAGVTPQEVYDVLKSREAQSGLEEKARRGK